MSKAKKLLEQLTQFMEALTPEDREMMIEKISNLRRFGTLSEDQIRQLEAQMNDPNCNFGKWLKQVDSSLVHANSLDRR